jgi:pyruvate dehydrogenase complex dehydrogenase (E1) component
VVEKGSTFGWDRWVGPTGAVIGMHTFGASAPLKRLQAKFGFTVEHIVATALAQLSLEHDADAPGVTLETSDAAEPDARRPTRTACHRPPARPPEMPRS